MKGLFSGCLLWGPRGSRACGQKPAFNLWLQEGMALLSAGRGPAWCYPVRMTVQTGFILWGWLCNGVYPVRMTLYCTNGVYPVRMTLYRRNRVYPMEDDSVQTGLPYGGWLCAHGAFPVRMTLYCTNGVYAVQDDSVQEGPLGSSAELSSAPGASSDRRGDKAEQKRWYIHQTWHCLLRN